MLSWTWIRFRVELWLLDRLADARAAWLGLVWQCGRWFACRWDPLGQRGRWRPLPVPWRNGDWLACSYRIGPVTSATSEARFADWALGWAGDRGLAPVELGAWMRRAGFSQVRARLDIGYDRAAVAASAPSTPLPWRVRQTVWLTIEFGAGFDGAQARLETGGAPAVVYRGGVRGHSPLAWLKACGGAAAPPVRRRAHPPDLPHPVAGALT